MHTPLNNVTRVGDAASGRGFYRPRYTRSCLLLVALSTTSQRFARSSRARLARQKSDAAASKQTLVPD